MRAEDSKDIKWLKSSSPAFKALQEIVTDKNLLKAFPQITEFCHTGSLEIFHSVLLKYCPKRQHFPHAGELHIIYAVFSTFKFKVNFLTE